VWGAVASAAPRLQGAAVAPLLRLMAGAPLEQRLGCVGAVRALVQARGLLPLVAPACLGALVDSAHAAEDLVSAEILKACPSTRFSSFDFIHFSDYNIRISRIC